MPPSCKVEKAYISAGRETDGVQMYEKLVAADLFHGSWLVNWKICQEVSFRGRRVKRREDRRDRRGTEYSLATGSTNCKGPDGPFRRLIVGGYCTPWPHMSQVRPQRPS